MQFSRGRLDQIRPAARKPASRPSAKIRNNAASAGTPGNARSTGMGFKLRTRADPSGFRCCPAVEGRDEGDGHASGGNISGRVGSRERGSCGGVGRGFIGALRMLLSVDRVSPLAFVSGAPGQERVKVPRRMQLVEKAMSAVPFMQVPSQTAYHGVAGTPRHEDLFGSRADCRDLGRECRRLQTADFRW
jgi:hypothetical protein